MHWYGSVPRNAFISTANPGRFGFSRTVIVSAYALDGEFGPVAEGVAMFVEIAAPAIVMLEQQLCGARNIHGAESTWRLRAGKGRRHQPAHATGVLILCGCQRGGGAYPTARGLVCSSGAGVEARLDLKDG